MYMVVVKLILLHYTVLLSLMGTSKQEIRSYSILNFHVVV
jgi:hypothetical protein